MLWALSVVTSSAGQAVVHGIVLPTIDESYGRLERMWSCSASQQEEQQKPPCVIAAIQVRRTSPQIGVCAH
jgi:hypothetical protein